MLAEHSNPSCVFGLSNDMLDGSVRLPVRKWLIRCVVDELHPRCPEAEQTHGQRVGGWNSALDRVDVPSDELVLLELGKLGEMDAPTCHTYLE